MAMAGIRVPAIPILVFVDPFFRGVCFFFCFGFGFFSPPLSL